MPSVSSPGVSETRASTIRAQSQRSQKVIDYPGAPSRLHGEMRTNIAFNQPSGCGLERCASPPALLLRSRQLAPSQQPRATSRHAPRSAANACKWGPRHPRDACAQNDGRAGVARHSCRKWALMVRKHRTSLWWPSPPGRARQDRAGLPRVCLVAEIGAGSTPILVNFVRKKLRASPAPDFRPAMRDTTLTNLFLFVFPFPRRRTHPSTPP